MVTRRTAIGTLALGSLPLSAGLWAWSAQADAAQDRSSLQWLQRCGARLLADGEAPQLGDIGVWRYGRTHSHGGIVVEAGPDPLIVHAYIRRKVITTRVSEAPLAGAPVCYWSTC